MSNKPPPSPPPSPPPHPPKKQTPPPPPPPPIFSPLTPPHTLKKPPPPPPPPYPTPSPSPQPLQPPPPSTGDNKTYRDCIQGICSINCPQLCTFLPFPPPPPFFLNADTSDDDSSKISPLMASLIAVLTAAFLLLFYYTVVSRYLRRRSHRHRHRRSHIDNADSSEIRLDPMVQDPARPAGLDDSFIRQITVFKYRRGDGLVEGTECAVCLSEFGENESLRLMPNCEHAFHIPCIDTWLRSHSNCPLCRSGMDPDDPVRPNPGPTSGVNLAHMRIQRSDDAVLVVREVEGEVIVCHEMDVRESGEDQK